MIKINLFLLLLITSCTTSNPKVTTTERDPATILEPKNGGESFLDIRRVPLPDHLQVTSAKENGIQIFECFVETDNCQPLVNEVVTYEEAKASLIIHNITYGAIGGAVILVTVAAILNPPMAIGGAAVGATATTAAGTVGVPLLGPVMAGAIIARAAGKKAMQAGIKSIKNRFFIAGMAGGITGVTSSDVLLEVSSTNIIKEGRQVRVAYLPKDGPLLRKLLSTREIIPVNNIEKIKRELTEIIQLIVNNRR